MLFRSNDKAFKGQISKALPAITLLDTAQQYVFVNQGTGEPYLTQIQDMPADGAVVDCGSDKVPSEAKGVIIAALVANPVGRLNAVFVCSDGNFCVALILSKRRIRLC